MIGRSDRPIAIMAHVSLVHQTLSTQALNGASSKPVFSFTANFSPVPFHAKQLSRASVTSSALHIEYDVFLNCHGLS